jgi:hypothetical protein
MRGVLIAYSLPHGFVVVAEGGAADQEEPMTELQAAPLTDWTTVAPLKTSLITVGPLAKATDPTEGATKDNGTPSNENPGHAPGVVAAPALAIGAAITNALRRAAAAADRFAGRTSFACALAPPTSWSF